MGSIFADVITENSEYRLRIFRKRKIGTTEEKENRISITKTGAKDWDNIPEIIFGDKKRKMPINSAESGDTLKFSKDNRVEIYEGNDLVFQSEPIKDIEYSDYNELERPTVN